MNQQTQAKPTDGSGVSSGMTSIVAIAENAYQQGATDGGNTVTTLAVQRPAGSEKTANDGQRDTVATTKLHKAGNVTVKTCQQCGAEYVTRRPKISRYCSGYCRRLGWLAANPEKAAAVAEADKARLKAHVESKGRVWEDRQ